MNDENKFRLNEKKSERDRELDDFWDLSSLVPKTKNTRPTLAPRNTTAVDIMSDAPTHSISEPTDGNSIFSDSLITLSKEKTVDDGNVITRFIPPHSPKELQSNLTPEYEYDFGGFLIKKVTVSKCDPPSLQAREYAKYLHILEAKPSPDSATEVRFDLFTPHLMKMNKAQENWYLYWREQARNGNIITTYSDYVRVLFYELINSENENKLVLRDLMCSLWLAFREKYSSLDQSGIAWICDYSLIHKLPRPEIIPVESYTKVLSNCSIKEYFLDDKSGDLPIEPLITFCSDFDYKSSRFYKGEFSDLYAEVVKKSVGIVVDGIAKNNEYSLHCNITSHRSFYGAVCSERMKKLITVNCNSFSNSHTFRFIITDTVRYVENCFRISLGIKSRLSIYYLPDFAKRLLDAYLPTILPKKMPKAQKKAELEEYEKKYEPESRKLDISRADKIEKGSWETARSLIDAFENDTQNDDFQTDIKNKESNTIALTQNASVDENENNGDVGSSDVAALFGKDADFIRFAIVRDIASEENFARKTGESLDLIADRINTRASDIFGDIILEEYERGYGVIDDYTDEMKEVFGND